MTVIENIVGDEDDNTLNHDFLIKQLQDTLFKQLFPTKETKRTFNEAENIVNQFMRGINVS